MREPAAMQRLLREAAALRLLGLLFERPAGRWRAQIEQLAGEIGETGESGENGKFGEAGKNEETGLRDVALDAADSTEGIYLAVLGPGGRVSPREVYYRGMEDPGRILADVLAFYQAFAFAPNTEEPADHVAVQVGFLGYLRLKEAYAVSLGLDEAARTTREAFDRFGTNHLRLWSGPFSRALAGSGVSYLEEAGRLLVGVIGSDPDSSVAPVSEEVEPFSCAGMGCEADCGVDGRTTEPFEI
jgi:hypothetical protein